MTTSSMSLTNSMVLLPQSCDSSHHVSETKCPPYPTHLPLLRGVDSTSPEPSMQTTRALLLKYKKFKPHHNCFQPIAFCCKWSFTHLLILSLVFHTFNPKHLKKILLTYTSTCSWSSTSFLKSMGKKTQTHLSQSG
jgi:hypothetical protein